MKRYKVQVRRKDTLEMWTEWTQVDNYRRAEEHAHHAEEVGFEARIVTNEEVKDCRTCQHFVGCEEANWVRGCDLYEEGRNENHD